MPHDALANRFQHLDALLTRYRSYWQFQAFHREELPGGEENGQPFTALQALCDEEFLHLQRCPEARAAFLSPWLPEAEELAALCCLPRLEGPPLAVDKRLSTAVPGRKWQQLKAVAALVPGDPQIVEWCAGKGHLGRVLAARGQQVSSLEWSHRLCSEGRELARRAGVTMDFANLDVLAAGAQGHLGPGVHTVALHACGDLHLTLLRLVGQRQTQGLTLSPCCYHLTRETHYRPLSRVAGNSRLRLAKADLHMVVQQTVTAPSRTRHHGRTEVIWRLGFDALQRSIREQDQYLPVPTVPKKLLRHDFANFAQWAAAQKGLTLPAYWDSEHYREIGQRHYRELRRVECLQHLFQRPLELWLILDAAMYLGQQGYQVEVGEFCDPQLTPRNILIRATPGQNCARR